MTTEASIPTRGEDNDDRGVGQVLPRREVLALFASAGAALLVACSGDSSTASAPTTAATGISGGATGPANTPAAPAAVPSCVVVPALTEGPYFVDEGLNRSDIRSDPSTGTVKPGVPLSLTFNVSRVSGNACSALSGAKVDIWQCDAKGNYSDVSGNAGGSTVGQKFLRGFQDTDARGQARFTTIFPGWYPGRAIHIHFKVRSSNKEFVSQLFFDDALSDEVFAQAAYQKAGSRVRNAADGIYREAGDVLLLRLARSGDGYSATFDIGLQT